jgi:hypothetical protein
VDAASSVARRSTRRSAGRPPCEDGGLTTTEDRMSDIEHPSNDHEDENISLVNSTLGFAASAVVALVGMFGIILYNHFGGF